MDGKSLDYIVIDSNRDTSVYRTDNNICGNSNSDAIKEYSYTIKHTIPTLYFKIWWFIDEDRNERAGGFN